MSIANTMHEMQAYLRETYQALIEKQAIIPEKKNLVNVPTAIRSISTEGGSTLPILNLNLPNEIEYNFDELKTGVVLPLSNKNYEDYEKGDLLFLTGFKTNQEGWPINSGGSVYCEQNWKTKELSLDINIWNSEDFGYQVICMGAQEGYQPFVKNIPIIYTAPTKVAQRIHLLDQNGLEVKNRLSLEDIEVYNVATGEQIEKKYFKYEAEYWTDTFYITIEPNVEYEVRVTLFDEVYTGTFINSYAAGNVENIDLYILPTLWGFECHAVAFTSDGYQIDLLANYMEVIQYRGDEIVKQEIVRPGANENNLELICAYMLPDIDKYTIKLQAPYFTTVSDEFNYSSPGNTWTLTPNFDTSTKRCKTFFAGIQGGGYYDRIALNESNTIINFLTDNTNGEYTFENGCVSILADINAEVEIAIGVEGYDGIIQRIAFRENHDVYTNWRFELSPLSN